MGRATLSRLRASEPVRLMLYPLLAGVVAYLAITGVVDADFAQVLTAVVALVLGVPLTEAARGAVYAPTTVPAVAAAAASTVLDEAEQAVTDAFGPRAGAYVRQVREGLDDLPAWLPSVRGAPWVWPRDSDAPGD
ncbi:hypothetical protein ACTD5D_39720 [Nocardia takedensis]|uniref:hypothetical protein n=1 Tax=Nocardia takedensis TaxID=259390 RepID=UPI003F75E55D